MTQNLVFGALNPPKNQILSHVGYKPLVCWVNQGQDEQDKRIGRMKNFRIYVLVIQD
jgi:hypothetical protein